MTKPDPPSPFPHAPLLTRRSIIEEDSENSLKRRDRKGQDRKKWSKLREEMTEKILKDPVQTGLKV